MNKYVRDEGDLDYQQKLSGSKTDVEWRLRNAAVLSLVVFLLAAGLIAFTFWVASRVW